MPPSNQKGLIWGPWQTQECGRAVETTAVLMGLLEFHIGELFEGVGVRGLWFVVSGRRLTRLHTETVSSAF